MVITVEKFNDWESSLLIYAGTSWEEAILSYARSGLQTSADGYTFKIWSSGVPTFEKSIRRSEVFSYEDIKPIRMGDGILVDLPSNVKLLTIKNKYLSSYAYVLYPNGDTDFITCPSPYDQGYSFGEKIFTPKTFVEAAIAKEAYITEFTYNYIKNYFEGAEENKFPSDEDLRKVLLGMKREDATSDAFGDKVSGKYYVSGERGEE